MPVWVIVPLIAVLILILNAHLIFPMTCDRCKKKFKHFVNTGHDYHDEKRCPHCGKRYL